jgi:hypothetical protein
MSKAKDILRKIEEEKIEPKSKWLFLVKDYLIWFLFLLAIVIGSVAWSVIVFLLLDNDWDVYMHLERSFISSVIISLPYIWIIIVILFYFLAYFNYKHTKGGYKIKPLIIVSVSVLVSIVLGGFLLANGFGRTIDSALSQNVPYYEKMIGYREDVWNNPDKGLLGGRILKMKNENNFLLEGLDDKRWKIVGDNIFWSGHVSPGPGVRIKVIGEKRDDNLFYAEEVRPWIGRHMMHKNNEKFGPRGMMQHK